MQLCTRAYVLCSYFCACFSPVFGFCVFFSFSSIARAKGAEMTLHCFGVPMAVAIILAEREVAMLLRLCAFLESWLLKGFYISL